MTKADKQEQYKNRIITELFESGIMQKKIGVACAKHHISYGSKIHEDVLGEVFWHISRLKADKVIEMYEDKTNGGVTPSSRLTRISTRIMSLQGFAKKKGYNYPKQSAMTFLLFASNLNGMAEIGYMADREESDFDEDGPEQKADETDERLIVREEPNFFYDVWELVRDKLSRSDLKFLEKLFTTKKGKGKYKKEVTDRLKEIKLKIKEIVKASEIKI